MRSGLGVQSGVSTMAASSRLAVGYYNLRRIALDPSEETYGTRIDAVRGGRRGRRAGRTRGRDPAEAARGAELGRTGRVRDRKGLGDRGTHPLRRRDGPARTRGALPRLEGSRRPARDPGERGPV